VKTNAYFENIQVHLLKELRTAQNCITAVIYALLCEKAKEGVSIRALQIDDHISHGPGTLDFTRLANRDKVKPTKDDA